MQKLVLAVFFAVPAAAPAFADTAIDPPGASEVFEARCVQNWKRADKNGDRQLDQSEIDAAEYLLPDSLRSSATISEMQFLDACVRAEQKESSASPSPE